MLSIVGSQIKVGRFYRRKSPLTVPRWLSGLTGYRRAPGGGCIGKKPRDWPFTCYVEVAVNPACLYLQEQSVSFCRPLRISYISEQLATVSSKQIKSWEEPGALPRRNSLNVCDWDAERMQGRPACFSSRKGKAQRLLGIGL